MPAFSDAEASLASFSDDEIRITRHAFQRLLAGHVTDVQALPAATGLSPEAVEVALNSLLDRGTVTVEGEPGRITAARGLSLARTRHRLTFDGRKLYAFCAVDAVGIPAALKLEAVVESRCHHCGAPLKLALTHQGPRGEGAGGRHDLGGRARPDAEPPRAHVTAHQLLLLGRAPDEMGGERASRWRSPDARGRGRSRAAPVGRDAVTDGRERGGRRGNTTKPVTVYWATG